MKIILISVLIFLETLAQSEIKIPKKFLLGAATSAYQIEGAWNVSGKGESIWDRYVHEHPESIVNSDTGDIADDSYHKYKEDIQLAKNMSLDIYRFSISWTRILPTGDLTQINQDGIDYYNNLINELIKNNIIPMITISHWDLPQRFQEEFGGWTNPLISDYFADFARLLFKTYGDRVKYWLTLNEPFFSCSGYSDLELKEVKLAPGVNASDVGNYMCGHTQLLSHAKAYRLYQNEFKATQNGLIGFASSVAWGIPKTSSPEDKKAAERFVAFQLDWFAHPIYSKDGNYPPIMIEQIAKHSLEEGLGHSRLPKMSKEDIQLIQGSADYIGLNYYTTFEVSADPNDSVIKIPKDVSASIDWNPSWSVSNNFIAIVPEGLDYLINYFHKTYPGYDIIITENGFPDDGNINDDERIDYLKLHLNATLSTINGGCPVFGYIHWALIDNMEWNYGYSVKYGLGYVDFNDPDRPRTMKKSAYIYKDLIESRVLKFD